MAIFDNPNTVYLRDEAGQPHNDNGPAVYDEEGYQAWFIHGTRHRLDGPAIIDPHDGSREWWVDGNLHREDGPAVEYDDGYQEWWVEGTQVPSPEERLEIDAYPESGIVLTPIEEDPVDPGKYYG